MKKIVSIFVLSFSFLFFLGCEDKKEASTTEKKVDTTVKNDAPKISVKEKKRGLSNYCNQQLLRCTIGLISNIKR